jgi:photosystem II stability/assembly factor-like uncharacterized protein
MPGTFVRTAFVVLMLFLLSGPAFGQLREIYLDADSSNAINKLSFFSPNEGYVAFTKWIGHTTDSGRTFTKLYITNTNVNYNGYSVNLTFGFEIAGVKAFNAATLIAYGDYGLVPAILYSSNGGTSWTLVFQSQYSPTDFNGGITDMLFPLNDNNGYAIDADRILKTTNGGQSWAVVATYPNSFFNHLEAVDDNTVFAMSTGSQTPTLLETTNGGNSWQTVTFPYVSGGVMTYTYFLNATTGWMSLYDPSYNLYFYQTTNGGASWALLNNLAATPFNCGKMHFTDANTGYALVAPFQVYKTLNGGALWEPLSRNNQFTYLGYTFNDLQFNSPSQFWAGGGHGFLELSTNSGGTPIPTACFAIDTIGEYSAGTVYLINYSNPAYQCKWLVNSSVISTTNNASYTHTLSRFVDTITLIVTSGGISDTTTKYQYFTVPNLPAITSFTPQGGGTGTMVTINGSGLSNVTGVAFGGTAASSFTVVSDNVITAIVGAGATGAVSVTVTRGSSSFGTFTFYATPSGPPPVITAVSPSAAPAGSTITITGTGFGASASANMVKFGTIRAAIQSATSTSIVCTVPGGASFSSIYVYNMSNGLTAQSPRPFSVSFPDSSNFTPTSFNSAFTVAYNQYTYPLTIQGKDIDGDGKPDLLVYYRTYGDTIAAYRNISQPGAIAFAPKVTVLSGPDQLTAGVFTVNDLDGDGLPDVIANVGYMAAFRNTSTPGNISFGNPIPLPGAGASGTAVADFDNDGRNDLATAGYPAGVISVLRNTGVPGVISFGAPQLFPVGGNPNALAAGDIDGDGKADLMTYDNGNLVFLRNTSTVGNIAFVSSIQLNVPGVSSQGLNIALVDYDGDGKLDAVIVNDNNLCIFRNISTPGNISFAVGAVVPLSMIGQGASLSNYGGGSTPDVLIGDFNYYYYLLFRNNSRPGTIGNDPGYQFQGSDSYYTDAADFDGDGKPDIATVYPDYNSIAVLHNTVGAPQSFQICTAGMGTLSTDMTGTVYQWQRNTGSGYVNITDNDTLSGAATATLTFNNAPIAWNGYKYRCKADSLYSSVFSLNVITTINHGVSISTSDSVLACYGSPATFNATPLDTTNNYMLYWSINNSETIISGNTFTTTTLQNKDQVQVILYVTDACGYYTDTSRAITMHVTEIPDSITISTPTTNVCNGDSATFTATSVNPGPNPIYTWTLNRYVQPVTGPVFTTSAFWTDAPDGENLVQATLKSSLACADPTSAVSNIIDINLLQKGSLYAQVNPDATTICQGSGASFYVSISAPPGTNIVYNWLVNGVSAGEVSPYFYSTSLNNQDTVQCITTTNRACLTSDTVISAPVVMTVNPIVSPAVSVTPADTLVCVGSNPIFTARPLNGGNAPTYQWWVNGVPVTGDQPTYTITKPTNGTTITVSLTSNASCLSTDTVTSSPVVLSVNTPTVLIAGDTALPAGASTSFTATANSAGTNPTYVWQDSTTTHSWQNLSATGSTITYAPVAADWLRCILTDATGCSATSNTLTFDLTGGTSGTNFYPNPAYSTLNIANTEPNDPLTVLTVTDVLGNRCLTLNNLNGQDPIVVNVAHLVNGIYFVTLLRTSGKTSHFSFEKL